jgi:AraC family transcriptional regulator
MQRVRSEAAAVRPQTSKRSIIEPALDAGSKSAAAFSRAFEQRIGLAPAESCATHRFNLGVRAAQRQQSNIAKMIYPEIRQRPATLVAYIRHVGPYDDVSTAWQKLASFANLHRLFGPRAAFIGISRDDPAITASSQLRYDACITLDHEFTPTGEVGLQTIPGGRYAVFLHRGPYRTFAGAYGAIYRDWLPVSGEKLRDEPAFELHLNTPDRAPPAELRTEIWVPLENKEPRGI